MDIVAKTIATRHPWDENRVEIKPPEDRGPSGELWIFVSAQATDSALICYWRMRIDKRSSVATQPITPEPEHD